MSGKQHKREEKARKRAAREQARREERRRNIMTGLVVAVIIALGGVLIFLSVTSDGDAELADQPTPTATPTVDDTEAAGDVTEAPGTEAPAPAATEVVADDPSAAPGEPVDSGREPQVDDRPVACGADEPPNLTETRPMFPGGPADVLTDGVDYAATVATSCGTVTIDLLEDEAPEAVNSFVFLAQQGFLDGLEIFRNATTIGALQTGGGDNSNTWQVGYSLPDELGPAQTSGYPPGAVAMANSGPNTAGSQFFFVYNDSFDTAFQGAATFTVFAQATEGLDVLEQIGAIPTLDDDPERPEERIYMNAVTITPAGQG